MEPTYRGYLGSWSSEFNSRASRVRQLIGDAHWLSDGAHKEFLLADFLRRHIAPNLLISRGFVRPPASFRSCSPEVDVLIADAQVLPPLFNEGGLMIIPPGGVRAHLQCKSKFTSQTLREALANQIATQFILQNHVDLATVWCGVVFSDIPASRTLSTVADTVRDVLLDFPAILKAFPDAVEDRPTALTPHLLPKCICTYDSFAVFIAPSSDNGVTVKVFDAGDLALASLACDLFSFLTAFAKSPHAIELRDLIVDTLGTIPEIRNVTL